MQAKSSHMNFGIRVLLFLGLLMTLVIFAESVSAATLCVNPGGTGGCYSDIKTAVDAAAAGDTVTVAAGTYTVSTQIDLDVANLTVQGAGSGSTIVQVSGTGYRFNIAATDITIDGFGIEKTDKTGVQNIIYVAANNTTITNNEISGQYVFGDGDVSRAMEFTGGLSGLNISGNTIHELRQPGYINGVSTGTISNNYVYLTRGWVVAEGNMTFTGNTWGTGANSNVYDIAILSGVNLIYYTDILAMSAANNDAFIEDQRTGFLSIVYVDGSVVASGDGTARSPKKTISEGVARIVPGGTVHVLAGTYDEDVNINKRLTLLGAAASTTFIRGVIGGDSATIRISSSNVTVEGFTITRLGNNPADWNNPGLNSAGIAIQGTAITGATIQNNILTGNRTGIDINDSSGHKVSNNTITDNRTGMLFRNTTNSMTVVNNAITNNWTMGILFLDASGGTNSPVQSALSSTFSNNNLSGNWYGQVVERQTGGSLPLPGTTNLKNFVGNWWGTATPVVSVANSTEPGYSAQIPVAYGGTATPPGGQPDILGPASANIIYLPVCFDVACTKPVHNVTQSLDYLTIQSAIDAAAPGDEIHADSGTYVEDLVIDKALTLLGPNAAINPNTGSRVAEAVIQPSTSNPNPSVCTNMVYLKTSNISIKGFTFDGNNPALTGGVIINGSDVDACEILAGYEGMGNITVENNILKRATYAGVDFYNYYNATATSSNYIRYNRFEDIGTSTYGYGMGVLIYNNFYAAITDNVMTGVRVGIQTGNFYQSNPGSTNSISNNEIGSWRLGIFHNLWYGTASPLTVSNNTMTAENYTGATNYSGILLSSMGTTVGTTVTDNTVTVPGTDTHSGYTTGYNVWNVQNGTPITINGGTVTGGKYGVFVNNYEGYSSNANNTSINVDGIAISDASTAGVYVLDSPSNTNGATVNASIQNSTISNSGTGILVEGSHGNASLTTTNVTASATNDGLLVRSGSNVAANNTLDVNGDVTVQAGGTLVAGASSQINVSGDWTNNGTFTAGTGKVKFDGAVGQSIGGANPTTFNDLDLSNTHASGITSSVNATVNGALAMNQASNLNMGANTLTMGTSSAAATTGTGQGDVVGKVTRTSFTSGTTYNFGSPFLAFNNLTFATAPTDISVTLATSAPGTFSSAILRTYTINVTGGSTVNTNLRLHYRDDALNGNAEGALDAYRYNGTAWDALAATTRNASDNWVQRDSVSTFSDWTLSDGAPTSVTLTKFSGRNTDAGIKLNWETGSELNLIGFNVWRARGKGEFVKLNAEPIAALNPGNTNSNTYTYFDPLSKKGRYRYKLELLTTGEPIFSETISVRFKPEPNACATVTDKAAQLTPKNKAVITGKGVQFDWGDVACAKRYEFTLRENSADGALLVNETNLKTSSYNLAKLKAGTYFWSVRGCNAAGCGPAHNAQFTLERNKN